MRKLSIYTFLHFTNFYVLNTVVVKTKRSLPIIDHKLFIMDIKDLTVYTSLYTVESIRIEFYNVFISIMEYIYHYYIL